MNKYNPIRIVNGLRSRVMRAVAERVRSLETHRKLMQLFGQRAIRTAKRTNRKSLTEVDNWIDETAFSQSIFDYGLPDHLKHLVNLPIGEDITYADLLLCAANSVGTHVNYLEVGVSVGKTFFQILNGVKNAQLVGFDIENMNPILEHRLLKMSSNSWCPPTSSLRQTLSTDASYRFAANQNSVRYLAADVFDSEAWSRLRGSKFNVVFSDALHDSEAVRYEYEMLVEYDLIDASGFVLVWDDLHGPLREAFDQISSDVCDKFELPQQNRFIVDVRGWLGINYARHPVGVVIGVPANLATNT